MIFDQISFKLQAMIDRNQFIKQLFNSLLAMTGIQSLSAFKNLTDTFPILNYTMPVLFVGHGSPMNGIEVNAFSQRWTTIAKEIPMPTAILVISAHWYTKGTLITAMEHPKTIHDFGGFPKALYDVQYPAPGNAMLAKETASLIHTTPVGLDHDWGLDHGTWTIVRHMYN